MLQRNFRSFAVNLPWQVFDVFLRFKIARIYLFWSCDVIKFLNPVPEELEIFLTTILQTFIRNCFLLCSKQPGLGQKWNFMNLIFKWILLLSYLTKTSELTFIGSPIDGKIASCHGGFTTNDPNFPSSHSVHMRCDRILHPPFWISERIESFAGIKVECLFEKSY